MAAEKKHRVTLAGGFYQRGKEVFQPGDKLSVTDSELQRFPGKFIFPGGAPSGGVSAEAAQVEAAVAKAAEAAARAEEAEARVVELEAELAAVKELKTTPEGNESEKDPAEPEKPKGKGK